MIADVRDLRAIRRPDRVLLRELCVRGELVELACRDIVERDQFRARIGGKIPFYVLFEMVAVDDNRLGFLLFTLNLLFVPGFLFRVLGKDSSRPATTRARRVFL
jgi:hypothetical protein